MVAWAGAKAFFGRTAELVQVTKPRLHMEEVTSRVVRWLVIIVSSILSVALAFTALKGQDLIGILPLAVVLMASAIPVALPTMLTISMALGSPDLMKKGILFTRLSAIEDAAAIDIVCADKTGAITMNRLSVEEEMAVDPYSRKEVIFHAALAS